MGGQKLAVSRLAAADRKLSPGVTCSFWLFENQPSKKFDAAVFFQGQCGRICLDMYLIFNLPANLGYRLDIEMQIPKWRSHGARCNKLRCKMQGVIM
jgi:hypothetical protein